MDNFLDRILERRLIITHFQPIVSVKKHTTVGFEALSRGVPPDGSDGVICPLDLFNAARRGHKTVALDCLCRDKALEAFRPYHARRKDLLLFLNLEGNAMDPDDGRGSLIAAARQTAIEPYHIVIEIVESKVERTEELHRFVSLYRRAGFLIALDDVGTGHSNFDRIATLRPDIIKVDRSIISGLDREYSKQHVLRALTGLAHRLGALVIAEGIETEEEAIAAVECETDLLQGYLLSRPNEDIEAALVSAIEPMRSVGSRYRDFVMAEINARMGTHRVYDLVMSEMIAALSDCDGREFDLKLVEFIQDYPVLECVYVLDMDGIQVSDTICNPDRIGGNRRIIFRPDERGADQSLKDYFYFIKAGKTQYTTDRYISMASGNWCRTVSSVFRVRGSQFHILCADFSSEESKG
ncbi:MAG: EAL domain-containing protein [Deltaproteobacteria bacterium]|nr:EAL domain-containing protein [Deltaproteobacteria bacterium]